MGTGKAQRPLTERQRQALRLAAGRRKGLISAGHGCETPAATLRGLERRGLVEFVGAGGPYYDRRTQYRITEAGRKAAEEPDAAPEPAPANQRTLRDVDLGGLTGTDCVALSGDPEVLRETRKAVRVCWQKPGAQREEDLWIPKSVLGVHRRTTVSGGQIPVFVIRGWFARKENLWNRGLVG